MHFHKVTAVLFLIGASAATAQQFVRDAGTDADLFENDIYMRDAEAYAEAEAEADPVPYAEPEPEADPEAEAEVIANAEASAKTPAQPNLSDMWRTLFGSKPRSKKSKEKKKKESGKDEDKSGKDTEDHDGGKESSSSDSDGERWALLDDAEAATGDDAGDDGE